MRPPTRVVVQGLGEVRRIQIFCRQIGRVRTRRLGPEERQLHECLKEERPAIQPITKTGYRSYFATAATVDGYGGLRAPLPGSST